MLRVLAVVVLAPIAVGIAFSVAARLSDGPIAMFAGGPLERGELVTAPVADWSFAAAVEEMELQLVEPPRSRTVWLIVYEGRLYVPCGFMSVPLFKQWPYQAVEDGRAVIRVRGRRYERQLVRETDEAVLTAVAATSAKKYGFESSGPPNPDEVWFFRLDPRPTG